MPPPRRRPCAKPRRPRCRGRAKNWFWLSRPPSPTPCLFERIGFLLSTLVFMLGWQLIVERERWLKAVVVTVLCAAAMFTLFRYLLHVELPVNPFLS